MSPVAMYFASGESLYLGAALLLLVVITPAFLKCKWISRIRNVMAWVALALMMMACPPFPVVVDLTFLAVFALWYVVSNRSSSSQVKLQIGSNVVLVALAMILPAIEFAHRRMPRVTGHADDHLVVIGDSISSGIDPRVESWPLVLQRTCGVEVRSLAKPGAQVTEGLRMARDLRDTDHLVLIEIGGNDLLMGVPSEEFGKSLDALLLRVAAPNRTVVMFELPLLPNKIAYGQIQRRLSSKYGVSLIPKRYFAQVIGDANATTDGLHLSASGARQMAAIVGQLLWPHFKSCESNLL